MQRRTLLKQLGAGAALALSRQTSFADSPSTPGIFLNQIGYHPADAKAATVRNPSPDNLAFHVVSAQSGKPVLTGSLMPPTDDPTSGDRVSQAIFSSVTAPGIYRLEAAGVQSDPFSIRADVYANALHLTMRSYYGQRCGCKVDLGGGYTHPACHLDGAFHPSSGKSGKVATNGGWHDAGDYGRYVVNSGITTGTLLWAWELFPEALRTLRLDIPESGGKLPDFLAEIKWNLDWMLSLQDTDGGVWHKQTSERFCAFIMPQDDHLTSFVIGSGQAPYKTTAATADLASVAAIAARCYAPFDPAYAQRCLAAARRAFTWAIANPNQPFTNPAGVSTGGYGDRTLTDELLWASAELWRTTGESQYEQQFLAGVPATLRIGAPGWGNVGPLAFWTYVLSTRPGSPAVKDRIRAATLETATRYVAASQTNGYGQTLQPRDFGWGSNSDAGNQSLLLIIANRFAPNQANTTAALANLHYLLGRNCHGVSWVTQVGVRPFQHPHHRPSAADGIVAPWPGLLSGGPNSHPGDEAARTLTPGAPMRMWLDDQRAYSLNEIAINWNAPLVFLLAAAQNARG